MTMMTHVPPSVQVTRQALPDGLAARSLRLALADRLRRIEAESIVDHYTGPTAGPEFVPTADDDSEWAALLRAEVDRAYDALVDGLARQRMESAFAWDGPRETDGYAPGYCS